LIAACALWSQVDALIAWLDANREEQQPSPPPRGARLAGGGAKKRAKVKRTAGKARLVDKAEAETDEDAGAGEAAERRKSGRQPKPKRFEDVGGSDVSEDGSNDGRGDEDEDVEMEEEEEEEEDSDDFEATPARARARGRSSAGGGGGGGGGDDDALEEFGGHDVASGLRTKRRALAEAFAARAVVEWKQRRLREYINRCRARSNCFTKSPSRSNCFTKSPSRPTVRLPTACKRSRTHTHTHALAGSFRGVSFLFARQRARTHARTPARTLVARARGRVSSA
jgi:hypothetical protein